MSRQLATPCTRISPSRVNHIAIHATTITFMLLHAIERRTVEIGRDTPTNCSRWKVGRGGKSRAFKSPFKSAAINPWSEGTSEGDGRMARDLCSAHFNSYPRLRELNREKYGERRLFEEHLPAIGRDNVITSILRGFLSYCYRCLARSRKLAFH